MDLYSEFINETFKIWRWLYAGILRYCTEDVRLGLRAPSHVAKLKTLTGKVDITVNSPKTPNAYAAGKQTGARTGRRGDRLCADLSFRSPARKNR